MTAEIVALKCPACGRFLSETNGYARAVCAKCGWEITVRSKGERDRPIDKDCNAVVS